ncbi:DUF3301 domain-containing protein [Vibrio neptunius]|uniref:DUF3301 domain-containing protein n=1 Tax=Vibrio neptunius TaxID=170651 RepID=A0ABS3A6C4_9VIBR|nr:DUF3301 domain-containing protein [Vibrio neptunius]MBN3491551.1 DUF3301 domain-containing protein [Vibrio neptunius]MBN3514268.1 DUF3301 domain-containing protein [Vibrio neptunius]MBN3551123.1 DUF3301 domain-containing protein [Vibrio neptunius]MBN3579252.1 DUF3301 domain-containing protein [Vibrio neptunius]MCH9872916.1 DUF3301 domain-containing protein [Vibrio neptunius]
MIGDLLAILGLAFGCFLFWQQRRQAELAKSIAASKCKQLDLQLISVALKGHKLKTPDGLWRWHSVYQFEFSSLGDDCYQGKLIMQGFRLMKVDLPPHRM